MNALSSENSLYLGQHAHNPVDWLPWGEAAFKKAQTENKPLLVSSGYASCHWCHVMAKECFDNAYIADLMNRHFVCIKVDRDEHPHVDAFYMEAVQMITGRGGWPLNVFCLPNGQPFFGGTYFPAEDRGYGLVPWPQLIMRIADHYSRNRADLVDNSKNIIENIRHNNTPIEHTKPYGYADLLAAAESIAANHDDAFGGFGQAPKFPCPMTLEFLDAATHLPESSSISDRIDTIFKKTLDAIAHGGIHDALGGGFMRYAVDKAWQIPHFEKMLTDNALLIRAYAIGYQRLKDPLYIEIIDSTLAFLKATFLSPQGYFYNAQDADTEAGEGAYYGWTEAELAKSLTAAEMAIFMHSYGPTEPTQAPFYPTFKGTAEKRLEVKPILKKLLAVRNQRPAPVVDNKGLLMGNALLISALAEASQRLDRPDLLIEAQKLMKAILTVFMKESTLYSVAYGEHVTQLAQFIDYAALLDACASVTKCETESGQCLTLNDTLSHFLYEKIINIFSDKNSFGFFETAENTPYISEPRKVWLDNATPCGHSLMLSAMASLAGSKGSDGLKKTLHNLQSIYGGLVAHRPQSIAFALSVLAKQAV